MADSEADLRSCCMGMKRNFNLVVSCFWASYDSGNSKYYAGYKQASILEMEPGKIQSM